MASMGPFPSERRGRDIDDLQVWAGINKHPYEWNEFYCSKSWNIAPLSFPKFPVSPPPSLRDSIIVKRRRSSTSTTSTRRPSTDSIKSEEGGKTSRKSKRGSIKINKKKKKKNLSSDSSEKVSKPKTTKNKKKKKKKKTKKERKSGASTRSTSSCESFCTLDSADVEGSSDDFSSSFRSSDTVELVAPLPFVSPTSRKSESRLSAFVSPPCFRSDRSLRSLGSFGPLSPSATSLGEMSRSSIMGCDLPDDVLDYIGGCEELADPTNPLPELEPPPLLENPLVVENEKEIPPPKKTKKKKKKRKSKDENEFKSAKKDEKEQEVQEEIQEGVQEEQEVQEEEVQKEEVQEDVGEKKSTSARSKNRTAMETLPEEVIVSMNQDQNIRNRNLGRSLSPPKRNRRFSKLMVVADGSIRRAVQKNKAAFWDKSAERRGSVNESIKAALGEIEGIDSSIEYEDPTKGAERSVSTEITDPWHNSWSISSDSLQDNSDRAFKHSLLSNNPAQSGELIKRVTPI